MNPPKIGMLVLLGHFHSALPLLCQRTGQSSWQQNGFKNGALKLPTAAVFLGGGNSNIFFHPETMGKYIQFDEHILILHFSTGLVKNQQLVLDGCCKLLYCKVILFSVKCKQKTSLLRTLGDTVNFWQRPSTR